MAAKPSSKQNIPAVPVTPMRQPGQHYYPTPDQLKDPRATANALRVILDQFYALQDRHDALTRSYNSLLEQTGNAQGGDPPAGPPPGCGPTDTQILGLYVAPIDPASLANGASLKYNKVNGNFEFS